MEELELDLGMVEYPITGGGRLRFNPTDPNLYARFLAMLPEMEQVESRFRSRAKLCQDGSGVLELLGQVDKELKSMLGQVFEGNDFHEALGGIHLLALGGDGRTLAETLLASLEEILSRGAERLAGMEAQKLLQ